MYNNNDPYSKASDAYGKNSAAAVTDQRTLEGQALMKAAQKLEELKTRLESTNKPTLEEMDDALDYNRKLWTIFAGETTNEGHELPQELKNNIASLSIFIFKRTINIQSEPSAEKLEVLIEINRQIASGLLKQTPNTEGEISTHPSTEKQVETTPTDASV